MADIEMVIKIPETLKRIAKEEDYKAFSHPIWLAILMECIWNGTELPKGHGRILDEKDILDTENNDGGLYDLVDMPEYISGVKAIIEADKAESE